MQSAFCSNLKRQPCLTFSFIVSMASSTQPTVPSPPHTNTRTLPAGRRVHSWRALEGFSSDRSNTWRAKVKRDGSCHVLRRTVFSVDTSCTLT